MNAILIYVMTGNKSEAEKIAAHLLERNLVACANLYDGVSSMYCWQGKVEKGQECAMIVKTTAERFEDVEAEIVKLHSYECPCIVSWTLEKGHSPYLEWIADNTGM